MNNVGAINIRGDEYNLKLEEKEKNLDEKCWIVIKNTAFKDKIGYRLREGDVIKLGKVVFKIKEIRVDEKPKNSEANQNNLQYLKDKTVADNNNRELENINNPPDNLYENNKQKKKNSQAKCRICLMEDGDFDNPLINLPCSCKGSMRHIHVSCLQRWLKSKLVSKTLNHMVVHSFKNLECEICKHPIPGISYIFK